MSSSKIVRRAGDGWVHTPRGDFWGLCGAAGLLIHDPSRGVLLQHRVEWSAHGGTWGIPGGAIDVDETAIAGALRECREETGVPGADGAGVDILDTYVVEVPGWDENIAWSYTTVIARATETLHAEVKDAESIALEWVPLEELETYELHPGFAASLPHVLPVLHR